MAWVIVFFLAFSARGNSAETVATVTRMAVSFVAAIRDMSITHGNAHPPRKSNWRNLFLQRSVIRLRDWQEEKIADKLREHVISVSADNFHIFHGAEVEEMRGTVYFVVELFGIGQLELVTHVRGVANTCKSQTTRPLKLISDHDKGNNCLVFKDDV